MATFWDVAPYIIWKKLTDVLEITAPIIRVMIETATPLKRRSTCTRLQGATFQKAAIFIVAMIISNLTNFEQTFIEFLISDVYLNLSPKFNFNLCHVTYFVWILVCAPPWGWGSSLDHISGATTL
jgi:hypothetical protein